MKRIKKTDLRFAKKSDDLYYLVEDINYGGTSYEIAIWMLNPMGSINASIERKRAMSELLYSLAKIANSNDAWHVFTEIANKLGTCQEFVERWLRGIDNVIVSTQYGLNHIDIK